MEKSLIWNVKDKDGAIVETHVIPGSAVTPVKTMGEEQKDGYRIAPGTFPDLQGGAFNGGFWLFAEDCVIGN